MGAITFERAALTLNSDAKTLEELKLPFAAAWQRPHEQALRWKERGGRVAGLFWDYIPEELVHAAGVMPYRIMGSTEGVTESDRHMPTYVCALMRSALDRALKGKYTFLDGLIVAPLWCEAMKPLWELWRTHAPVPWMICLDLPGDTAPPAQAYFAREIGRMKVALEENTGREITDEALDYSVRTYNEGRRLLKRVFELRQDRLSSISSVEWVQIVLSSMVMPKEEHNQHLAELVRALEQEGVDEGDGPPRLHISGSILIDLGFLHLIDETGATVTSDDLYSGARWYWDLVDESLPSLEGIVQRYWNKLPCPARSTPKIRLGQMLELMRLGRSQAVVFLTEKHCDPHLFEDPLIRSWLEGRGVPCLQLDTEMALHGTGQVRTRIHTFVEMIRSAEGP